MNRSWDWHLWRWVFPSISIGKERQLKTNKTNQKHIDFKSKTISPSFVLHTKPVSYNESGNSVDIDKEMADLASNQIYYNALTERISGKFSSLQNVIRGGK